MVKMHTRPENYVQSTLNHIGNIYIDDEEKRPLILNGLDSIVHEEEPDAEFDGSPLYSRLCKISDICKNDDKKRSVISDSLDNLVNILYPEPEPKGYVSETAKNIRKKAGYTPERLSKNLGLSKTTVYVYESKDDLKHNPNSVPLMKYLIWLAEEGYNPFDIVKGTIPVLTKISNETAEFDFEKAKRVREKAEITQEIVAEKIGAASAGLVSSYEKGRTPKNPLKSMSFVKYLIWLSELGYDPYGIEYEYK